MRTLVIIGYVWPEPRSSAAGYHMLSFIELFLEQKWHVTFASPAALSEHRADLTAMGVKEVSIELNSASFDDWILQQNPDIVLFDRFMMEEQFGWRVEQQCPSAIRILDTEDLHSLRDARHQWVKQQLKHGTLDLTPLSSQKDLYERMSETDLSQREIASIYRCDLTLMISDFEIQLLTQAFTVPDNLLIHCPFMLPSLSTNQTGRLPAFSERQHFISIGNFRHAPNWDAVLWLKQQIWPLIRKQLPDAELHVYGAYPPPKATALDNAREGFIVEGWADDAHSVMQHARVLLAPLRFGAGIKGKLVDAMRNGTPSITTSIGVEGMRGKSQHWGGVCTDNAETFATEAINLYTQEPLWMASQASGYTLLTERYNKQDIQPRLLQRILPLLEPEQLKVHRRRNFTGLMLRHHHQKSTKYMAQWIEAKNKSSPHKS
ncbi:glycosyltransferase [Neptunomonas concharum]|uniref:Glycosyltransferase n=1 Tax=Neptunomonas concharum TaxID=1031538 RepID=A0A5P1REV5_9GAMM|nr:glycosyltransferase [Neptunomonas concharum]QEQ97801.1 glycosyltransferase [Neptunomonas concharum]